MSAMRRSALLALGLTLSSCSVDRPSAMPPQVRVEPHLNAEVAITLEAPSAGIVAVAVPQSAGRIVHYSLRGENILWNREKDGRSLAEGGYGLDLGPERTIARHPVLWEQGYQWAKLGTNIVNLTSEHDPAVGMSLSKQVVIDGATGALDIAQRMTNISEGDRSYCFWDRTLCKAGGYTLIPLNPKSRFRAGWVLGRRKVVDGKVDYFWWEYDGQTPSHPNIRLFNGILVAKSQGKEQKIGADSDAGWIAYAKGHLLFVKYFAYFREGSYTDNGLSVAHYFNENVAELEPLSPEIKLRPGGEYLFPERWTLKWLDREVVSPEDAAAVASRIPPSPFLP